MARAAELWTKAVGTLSDEDKQSIDFSRVDKPAILSDVLHAADQKKQTCMQKRWKFTKKNGEIVIIRDVCEKLIKWVNKFKEVGDVAVQYDPAHASLPWAAVRFFLQLSVNDVQTFGAVAEGLELVSSLIARCALYEQLYLSRPSTLRSDLEATLVRLYTAILLYLAKARRYYTKKTDHILAASVIDTSESVQAALASIALERDEVERCTRLVDSELSVDTGAQVNQVQASVGDLAADLKSFHVNSSDSQESRYQALKVILSSLEQPILRAGILLSDLHVELQKDQRRRILSWLSNVRCREHHRSSYSAVMPGSCNWLRQKSVYVDWKTSSTSSILWIHGIPGSGKSKLLSTVVQGLLQGKSQHTATSAVAYFYCARDAAEPQRADPDEVMRTVLKQLACFDASQPIHPAVIREHDKRQRDANEDGLDPLRLSLRDCKDLVLEITDQLPAIIVIDALDECDPLRRHQLLQALRDIVINSNNLVKVMVSSRDDADIVCRLNNVPNVYIRSDDNGIDVERYIDLELDKAISEQRLLEGRVSANLQERILRTLKDGAHGMFLCVSLQIQNLCDPERMIVASDVEDALPCLPPTLFQLYEAILARIGRIAPHYKKDNDVQDSHIVKEEVLSLCCNFVVLDDTLDVYRFAHASVREFLGAQPGFDSQEINAQAAEEALHVIQSASRVPFPYEADFIAYAGKYWVVHYRDLDFDFRSNHPISSSVKSFFNRGVISDQSFMGWLITVNLRDISAVKNIHALPFANITDLHGTPLLIACIHGLLEVINELADNPSVDLNVENYIGETGLYIAVRQQYINIVERLLILGSDPRTHNIWNETALHRAAENGDKPMLLLLLQHGADVMAYDDQGWTALDWAAKGNHEDAVRSLIVNGAAEEAFQKYGEHLIHWAQSSGDKKESRHNFLPLIHRATGCVGIRNEGQTGYLNSILHLLYSLQYFPLHLEMINRVEDVRPCNMAYALEEVFTMMESSEDVISTKDLTITFGWGDEQLQQAGDPIEFYKVLMHRIAEITSAYGTLTSTKFEDLFWSEVVYFNTSWPPEPALLISIHADGNRHLEEAMRDWADDRWLFGKLAPVFIIQIQRYEYDMAKDSIEKVHSHLAYPPRLTLDQQREPLRVNYVLHGVLVHMGFGINGGKSFIYLKSHSTGRWIRCRNEHVTWATEQEVFDANFGSGIPKKMYETCTAYGLIYLDESRVHELARVMVPYGDRA
ncbi:MAG: hypothetical protein Q9210_006409 [Variospora velana]